MKPRLPFIVIPSAALWSCLFLPLAVRGEPIPRVSLRLEPEEVVRGGTAVLTVSAAWEGEASELVFSRPAPPSCRGLAVAGSSQRGIAYREGSALRQVREFIFTLRGEEEGPGRVGPVTLVYRRPGGEESTLSTEPLTVSVVSRTAGREPSALPFPAVIALALAAAVLIALYIRWMVRRYQKKSNELIADYVENLESETLRELEGLRKHRLEGEPEKYCAGLRRILLHYRDQKTAAGQPPGEERQPESPAIPPEAEAELTRMVGRLEELRFGGPRDRMEDLDEIYRQAELLLKRLEDLTSGSRTDN
ncbi:MAG: hypothetical protein P9M08_12280 [Candidatus Erginobacter occultus]|nr:hypothetical protein [Candidatus Erginobacter occultus]